MRPAHISTLSTKHFEVSAQYEILKMVTDEKTHAATTIFHLWFCIILKTQNGVRSTHVSRDIRQDGHPWRIILRTGKTPKLKTKLHENGPYCDRDTSVTRRLFKQYMCLMLYARRKCKQKNPHVWSGTKNLRWHYSHHNDQKTVATSWELKTHQLYLSQEMQMTLGHKTDTQDLVEQTKDLSWWCIVGVIYSRLL